MQIRRFGRYTHVMKPQKIVLGLALSLLGATAFAQWQWIDKDGRKVYSDRGPTLDIPEKNIVKRPSGRSLAQPTGSDASAPADAAVAAAAPQGPASAPKSALDKELEAKKKAALDAEQAKKKADEERLVKARAENCSRAKQAQATIDSGVRMGRTNAAGEREIMDDAARAVEAKRIQGIVAADCAP